MGSARPGLRALVVVIALTSGVGPSACVPTAPSYDAGPDGPRSEPVDFLRFVHDRPAVGGDWYDYDEAGGHVISPLPHVYLLRDGTGAEARHAALRIVSYYDPDTAESGRFTLAYRLHDEGAWQPEQEWLTPKNIKDDGALCLDLFAKAERACGSDLWQVQLRATRWLALEGPIVVARPSLHVRSALGLAAAGAVRLATLDGRTSLSGLPDPTTVPALDDGPQASFEHSDWDRSAFAPDLPERGMAVGTRFVTSGFTRSDDVWLLLNARRSLVRFSARPVTDGAPDDGLMLTWTKVPVDIADDTVPLTTPAPRESVVDMPAPGARRYLSFEVDTLLVDVEGGLHEVPTENQWDLALSRDDDGTVRLLVSPGAAVYNATQRGGATTLEDAPLPTRTTP